MPVCFTLLCCTVSLFFATPALPAASLPSAKPEAVNMDSGKLAQIRSAMLEQVKAYHGGAFVTHGMIDPETKLVVVFMVQDVLVKDVGKAKEVFHKLVAESAK